MQSTLHIEQRRRRRRAPSASRARLALARGLVFCALLGVTGSAAAQEVVQPWQHLGDTLAGVYGWPNVLFHVGAAAMTPLLVYTADDPVQHYFQSYNPLTTEFAQVTNATGYVAPIAVPVVLYGSGLIAHDAELASAGAATIQAVVLQGAIVSTLKWLTDRAGPYPGGNPDARRSPSWVHYSNDPTHFNFNPFDLTGGLRWPSGHTASNFALVSALVAFYPDEAWIPIAFYPVALAIGIGMVEGDYHWFSDVFAGALIGHIIGWVTGSEFRKAFDAQKRPASAAQPSALRLQLVPLPHGLALAGSF